MLDPGSRDPSQNFPDGAGEPNEQAVPPLGGHAFAACTNGIFVRRDQDVPAEQKEVLLLLGTEWKKSRQAMVELRAAKKTIAITWQQPDPLHIAAQLANPKHFQLFQEICQRADGAIATTPDLLPFFNASNVRHAEFIPTPWPVEDARWNLMTPIEERRGIFIGTRDFGVPAQNHLAALLAIRELAASMSETVTVFNRDGWRGRRLIARLGFDEKLLRVIETRMPYPRYLWLIGTHKLVWQLDATSGVGHVAGEALLARVPCVGGCGITERLVFPDLCGHGRDVEQLFDLAARLLEHPHDCEAVMQRAQESAREKLSYSAVHARLESFFRRIARS